MRSLAAVAVLALAACQATAQKPQPLPYPPQRVFQNAYSFMPPHELGWHVLARNAHQLAFARGGSNPDETFAIQARVFQLPPYGSKDQFFEIIKKGLGGQASDQRYRILKHEVTPDPAPAATCVRSHFIAEDHQAVKRTATPGVLVLEVMTRSCAHPKNPNLAVALVYSHRYYPQHADAKFAEKAERLFSTVEYLE